MSRFLDNSKQDGHCDWGGGLPTDQSRDSSGC